MGSKTNKKYSCLLRKDWLHSNPEIRDSKLRLFFVSYTFSKEQKGGKKVRTIGQNFSNFIISLN